MRAFFQGLPAYVFGWKSCNNKWLRHPRDLYPAITAAFLLTPWLLLVYWGINEEALLLMGATGRFRSIIYDRYATRSASPAEASPAKFPS